MKIIDTWTNIFYKKTPSNRDRLASAFHNIPTQKPQNNSEWEPNLTKTITSAPLSHHISSVSFST